MSRPLYQIADDIKRSKVPVPYSAVPYVEALGALVEITDTYIAESGRSIVAYLISNLRDWRGEDARRIKAELRAL